MRHPAPEPGSGLAPAAAHVYDRQSVERLARQGIARGTDVEVRAYLEGELSRLEEEDPFAALGVDYDADDGAVRAAFLTATKQLHPNRFARHDREVKRLANEVFLRVKDAYLAIQERAQRQRILSRLGKGTAPSRIAAGTADPAAEPNKPDAKTSETPPTRSVRRIRPRRRAPARALTGAEELKKQVLAKEQEVEEEYARGKRLLLSGDDIGGAVAVFRQLAANHTSERRYRKWFHFAMGRQRESSGDHVRARNEFRRALDIDPTFEPAQTALARLPDEDTEKKGLFSKLFRR